MKIFSSSYTNNSRFLLVGNPNTGKTTLFNSLSKSNEHVGNWHGVTVSEKEKTFAIEGDKFTITDLPGLYSLTPLSYEEEVASDYIFKNNKCPIINICDINNLRRNLFLTLQLLEINSNIILYVNTFKNSKKVEEKEIENCEEILNKLNINYFIGDAASKKDTIAFKKKLKRFINLIHIDNDLNKFNYLNIKDFKLVQSIISEDCAAIQMSSKIATIRLMDNDEKMLEKLKLNNQKKELINKIINKNNFIILNKNRFDFINKLFIKNKPSVKKPYGKSALDKVLLNKYLALPIFLGVLFLVFYLTFFSLGATLSNFLSDLIQNTIGGNLVVWVKSICSIDWVIGLLEIGVIGGVGTLLAFLPQVILLFFFLSLIEDSGYLARIAFLFEDVFAKVGLSGKSVYALLMSFGCGTTAALTSRNMEDENAKIKTALLTPYMSCSAKLPIYAVIGGAFFGAGNIFVIFMLYILGVVVAILMSLLLEQKVLKSKEQSFILEFPEYKFPSFKRVFSILWENIKLFLIRIGTVIFALNIIIWIFQSFSFSFKFVTTNPGEISMLQRVGTILSPIFTPLGFGNWGATSALIAGFAAKEVIVSSIAMFNGINVLGDDMKTQTMRSILDPTAVVFFSPVSAISFMVFCLLYSPCLSTISVFRKEIGKKWTWFSIITQFLIAYAVSLVLYNLFTLVRIWGAMNVLFCFLGGLAISFAVIYLVQCCKNKKFCSYNCKECNKCKK